MYVYNNKCMYLIDEPAYAAPHRGLLYRTSPASRHRSVRAPTEIFAELSLVATVRGDRTVRR